MAGIAGIAHPQGGARVKEMLDAMAHRGPDGSQVVEMAGATLGLVWPRTQAELPTFLESDGAARDQAQSEHLAEGRVTEKGLVLRRDLLGVAPLYYGRDPDGNLCFASEVKALLQVTQDVREVPPGHHVHDGNRAVPYKQIARQSLSDEPLEEIAGELHRRLNAAIEHRLEKGEVGSWLSGGLDSSILATLARPHLEQLHTFAVGMPGSPDLEYARLVAEHIESDHHEIVVSQEDLLEVLPETIYHLESFDALLVRSSLTNYLAGRAAAEYVPAVLSGEGADELFAGYEYLQAVDMEDLPDELLDITGRLHNTALQRVDRCSAAHGIVAHVPFLDPGVVNYALSIPAEYKLHDGVEKWILRKALDGQLPLQVQERRKAKFWAGAGVGDRMAEYADERFTDSDFERERYLPNGWTLNTKEELLYYRIFCEQLGEIEALAWMGRTKGAPVTAQP